MPRTFNELMEDIGVNEKKEPPQKNFTRGRKWLNPPTHADTGAVQWYVDYWYGVDSEVTIWDCSRKIRLSFGGETKKDIQQRVKKLDILINALEDVKKNIVAAYEYGEEYGQ